VQNYTRRRQAVHSVFLIAIVNQSLSRNKSRLGLDEQYETDIEGYVLVAELAMVAMPWRLFGG